MRPPYASMLKSISVSKIEVSIRTLRKGERTPSSIRYLFWPTITLSMPGKLSRVFRYPSWPDPETLSSDIKLFGCGRKTIKFESYEEVALKRALVLVSTAVDNKFRQSSQRKDFNEKFDKLRRRDQRAEAMGLLRRVIVIHHEVLYPSDLTGLLRDIKREVVVQTVMES